MVANDKAKRQPLPGTFSPGVGYVALPSEKHKRVALYVSGQYFPGFSPSLDVLANSLWDMSAVAIAKSRFSYRKGVFASFDDGDLRFIHDALTMIDEDKD